MEAMLARDPTGAYITAGSLAGLLLAERYARSAVWVFKPLASAGFLYSAYTSPGLTTPFGQTMFAGLTLSALGDVLLIPSEGSPAMFTAGLGAFLLAHVAYGVAFVRELGLDTTHTAAAVVGGGALAAYVWNWLSPNLPAADRVPVAAYTTVIMGMVSAAIGSAGRAAAPWTQVAGAVLFQLSDILVARQQFVTKSPNNSLIGLPLYFGAQQLLASLLWA